ncbi:glutamine amidotransferase [Pseudomonas sp. NPDC089734]|uniref:glutamine amidotransferase n=1 Tax=Pseudomonas sp. NPDC089734 TaxID=3364469 RepID=UPI0037F2F318
MPQKPLTIIQFGTPPLDVRDTHGEQSDWMKRALHDVDIPFNVVRPHENEALPHPRETSGAVLTGSWSMVTDREPWSELTAEWIRQAMTANLPMLGICYGHQLMAHALGGQVGFHPKGREIGQHEIQLHRCVDDDPLLNGFGPGFLANLTHEQTVLAPPEDAVVLGRSEHDACQVLRYGSEALSVQFHPEFDNALMSACLYRRRDIFESEGYDIASMIDSLKPTGHAREILRRFAAGLTA